MTASFSCISANSDLVRVGHSPTALADSITGVEMSSNRSSSVVPSWTSSFCAIGVWRDNASAFVFR